MTINNELTLSISEIRTIGGVLSVAANTMQGFSGDLFIELGRVCSLVAQKRTAIVLVGERHADEIELSVDCVSEGGRKPACSVTCAEAFARHDETFGWRYAIAFCNGTEEVFLVNNKLGATEERDLVEWITFWGHSCGVLSRQEAEERFKDIGTERAE